MLETQKLLWESGPKGLDDLGIKKVIHPSRPLMILNYDQIASPKTHPVVRECRALVLRTDDFSLVARSFPRFFNWGEVVEEQKLFDWSNYLIQEKEDGSLILIFWEPESKKWTFCTRGSWGNLLINGSEMTWHDLLLRALHLDSLQALDAHPEVKTKVRELLEACV